MPIAITKSVGPAVGGVNKDFPTLTAFVAWLRNEPLVTNDEVVTALVYYNVPLSETFTISTKEHDATHYCIIKPAPGLGFLDLTPTGGPYNWANGGITWATQFPSSTANYSWITVRAGVSIQGFLIDIIGTAANDTTVCLAFMLGGNGSASYRNPELCHNFIRSNTNGAASRAISTGEYAVGGVVTDNIFWQQSGNGLFVSINYGTTCNRNTFIRTGTAAGTSATTGVDLSLKNNAYVGCGGVPAIGIPTAANSSVTNNFTDTAMTGNTGGFTVVAPGTMIVDPINNVLPVVGGSLINAATSSAYRTKDLRYFYRGTAPDVGAIELNAQPLPPLATAVITSQSEVDQTITINGTTTGDVTSGMAVITQGGVTVASKTLTFTGNTFQISFTINSGGSFDAPVITLVNDAGTGPAASGATAFTLAIPILPVITITSQIVVGRKLTITGTVVNKPVSGQISLAAAGTNPNGAVSQASHPIVITGNSFVATLSGIPGGNYAAPAITMTNGAGTTAPASGTTALTITPFVAPAVSGFNVQTIGIGQTFANMAAFATWLNARDLVANNEKILAYVVDDQIPTDFNSASLIPKAYDDTHYCLITPPPGYGVNDLYQNSPFDYCVAGVELSINVGSYFSVYGGVQLEGFRISINDVAGGLNREGIELGRTGSNSSNNTLNYPALHRNRITSNVLDASNFVVFAGTNGSNSRVYDNLFIHTAGAAKTISASNIAFERNTIARRGSAVGNLAGSFGYANTIRDNLMIGCSGIPITGNPTYSGSVWAGNVTDTALTSPIAGVSYGTNLVVDPLSDYTPAEGGGAIGIGSNGAIATKDIYNQNRGPKPDVGAKQLHPYIDLSMVTVIVQDTDGTSVVFSGTTTNQATGGHFAMAADTINPSGAVAIASTPFAIAADGTFNGRIDNVTPGNYLAPVITADNAGGTSLPASGVSPVSIIRIGGNPQSSDTSTLPGPTVAITGASINGKNFTISGTVNLQWDVSGTLQLFVDPLPSGVSKGPFNIVVTNGTWQYQGILSDYYARARVVATANSIPAVASTTFTIVKSFGSIPLPLK